jgi:hypothetical protein
MKKIYFALLLTIFLGFVAGNKASGQDMCQYCQYPRFCNVITFDVTCGGNIFPVEATICIECRDGFVYLMQLLEFKVPAAFEQYLSDWDCQDIMWDSLNAHVHRDALNLCGMVPCPQTVELWRTIPLCGVFIYYETPTHEKYTIRRFLPGDCNKRCVKKVKLCYNLETQQYEEREVLESKVEGTCPRNPNDVIDWNLVKNLIDQGVQYIRFDCAELWSVLGCP